MHLRSAWSCQLQLHAVLTLAYTATTNCAVLCASSALAHMYVGAGGRRDALPALSDEPGTSRRSERLDALGDRRLEELARVGVWWLHRWVRLQGWVWHLDAGNGPGMGGRDRTRCGANGARRRRLSHRYRSLDGSLDGSLPIAARY